MEEEEEEEERDDNPLEQQARPPAEPVVMRDEATTEESDDSGPPGLMDMDGNMVSSSSEDEDSDGTEEIARFVREEGRRRLGRLRLPELLNGNPGLGLGLLLGLGRRRVVEDDVDSNSDGDVDGIEAEEGGDRERFDRELPGRHDYLGEGREVRGVGEVEDLVSLPLFSQMHLSLMPGQTLPLHLFHPSLVSMMRTVLASPSKAFGVISLGVDKEKWAGTVGTTAHVYEVRESEEVPVGSPQEQEEVGLKLKAKGRQRFRLVSARRQSDGNLVGQVTLLSEIDLGDPLDGVRLKSQDRYRRKQSVAKEEVDDTVKEEEDMVGDGCLGRLHNAIRRRESNNIANSSNPVNVRKRRNHCQGMTRWLSPLPPWIWDLYDPLCLADRVKAELSKLGMARMTPVDCLPDNPADLSWWVAARLPLGDDLKGRILAADSVIQRLRMELSFLEQCRVLVCRRCGKQLGDQQHIFSMSKEGPQGAFVNPGGHVHETLTLHKAKNLRLVGEPSTQYSWFPGYAWTIVECSGCWAHIGWKFTASSSRLVPEKFYGFSRKSIESRREVPRGPRLDDQPEEMSDTVM